HDLYVHQLVEAGPHAVVGFVLRKGPTDFGEGQLPLRIRGSHPAAVVRVLEKHVLNGPIGRFELVRARDFDQFRRLWKARQIGLLCDGQAAAHSQISIRTRTWSQVWSELYPPASGV